MQHTPQNVLNKKTTFIMSKEKEIKIEDANANEKVDEQQTEKQAEQAQTDNLSAEDGKEKGTEELDPLAKAEQEVESLKKQLLYKTAEFENYRKRTLKEKADLILNGGEKTIAAILPILDDFERAIADKSEDPKVIKEGVQMIFNKFSKALESLGVKKIETQDKDFDVDYHKDGHAIYLIHNGIIAQAELLIVVGFFFRQLEIGEVERFLLCNGRYGNGQECQQ